MRLTTQSTIATKAHQSSSANLKANIIELKGQLKTKKGAKNDELKPQLVDLIVCAQGTKKEDKHILTKMPREDKVVLGRVGKDAVDKVSNQLALVKHNTSLEKLMVKDREKEIERLHKEKGNLERKHG